MKILIVEDNPANMKLASSLLKKNGYETFKAFDADTGISIAKEQSPDLIALGHHERWDGGGYPGGLKGDAISLPARIMQLADVYDALRSERPYKKAFDHAKTLEIITKGDGRTDPSHFNPEVLAAFQSCADTMAEIFEERRALEGQ